jgi:hypothetical protein
VRSRGHVLQHDLIYLLWQRRRLRQIKRSPKRQGIRRRTRASRRNTECPPEATSNTTTKGIPRRTGKRKEGKDEMGKDRYGRRGREMSVNKQLGARARTLRTRTAASAGPLALRGFSAPAGRRAAGGAASRPRGARGGRAQRARARGAWRGRQTGSGACAGRCSGSTGAGVSALRGAVGGAGDADLVPHHDQLGHARRRAGLAERRA